jgi:hypothetical protein
LKTFLTKIASTVALTADPPVICFWEWIWCKYCDVPKNRNLGSVSAKIELFFSPTPCIPTHSYPPWTHPTSHSHPRPRRAHKEKRFVYFFQAAPPAVGMARCAQPERPLPPSSVAAMTIHALASLSLSPGGVDGVTSRPHPHTAPASGAAPPRRRLPQVVLRHLVVGSRMCRRPTARHDPAASVTHCTTAAVQHILLPSPLAQEPVHCAMDY